MSRRMDRVLVADRGEGALTVARRIEAAGLEAVVVYADADAADPWLDDVAYAARIATEPGGDPYRDNLKLVSAALDAGCDAVHPGIGPGALDAELAHMTMNVGLAWIGATPQTLTACADRFALRRGVKELALPVVAQTAALTTLAEGETWLAKWHGPLRLSRGRGEGSIIEDTAGLAAILGDAPAPYHLERHVPGARHLLVAVLGDGSGAALTLGMHERTVRHAGRVRLRESPVFGLPDGVAEKIEEAARKVASVLGLVGVGAVEILVGTDGRWWVHDVVPALFPGFTLHEEVYGLEMVHAQIRLAAGETLGWSQDEIQAAGAGVELTVEATSSGALTSFELPDSVMVSTTRVEGSEVDLARDPLLARVLVTGPMRHAALVRARAALEEVRVEGVEHDTARLLDLLGDPRAWAGELSAGLLDEG